jgi:hypothetical protein
MPLRKYGDEPELDPAVASLQARAIVLQIKPLLAGIPSEIQGAVLADLLSLWLAGHLAPGNPVETDKFRAFLLDNHIAAVRALIPSSEQELLEGLQTDGKA